MYNLQLMLRQLERTDRNLIEVKTPDLRGLSINVLRLNGSAARLPQSLGLTVENIMRWGFDRDNFNGKDVALSEKDLDAAVNRISEDKLIDSLVGLPPDNKLDRISARVITLLIGKQQFTVAEVESRNLIVFYDHP